MESLAIQEVKELIGIKAKGQEVTVEFEVKKKEDLLTLIQRGQSFRRILIFIDKNKQVDKLDLKQDKFPWKELISSELSLKVTIENVKGNDNRLELARKVMGKLFNFCETELKFTPNIEMKKPDAETILCRSGEEYLLGIDLSGKDLNSRAYRVFANQASFKGDLSYYLVRKSGFKSGEKLLVGFAKDGSIAVEAALFANKFIVNEVKGLSWIKFPFSKGIENKEEQVSETIIYAFDESIQNTTAAKKNISLAKVKNYLNFSRYSLDELDVKFSEGEFDRIIFQITTKDEDKLNELFYQTSYLLKPKGTLLLITRKGLEISVPSKFKSVGEEEIKRGDSYNKLWLMERK